MRLLSIFIITVYFLFPSLSLAQNEFRNPREVIISLPFSGDSSQNNESGDNRFIYGGERTTDRFENHNEALYLDGINDWVGIDYSTSLAHQGEITLSIWAKGASSSSNFTTIIGRGSLNRSYFGIDPIGIGINNGNTLQVVVAGEQSIINEYINVQIDTEEWNHYLLSFRPGEAIKLYLNGELLRHFRDDVPIRLRDSFNGLNIGVQSRFDVLGRTFFNGAIDEVMVINRALKEEEIMALYSAGGWANSSNDSILSSKHENLIAFYPFDGNAEDQSSFENDGELVGALSTSNRFESPNSALLFDGENDFVNTLSTFDFPYRSFSYWFYLQQGNVDKNKLQVIISQDSDELVFGGVINSLVGNTFVFQEGLGVSRFDYSSVSPNEWYHVVSVREDSIARYYLNGQLVGIEESDNIASSFNPEKRLLIGTLRTKDRAFFHGKVDDLRIFNKALNESEIDALFNENQDELDLRSEVAVSNEADKKGKHSFKLFQNYPNPFNPTTTIQFDLNSHSEVQLKVYDISGKLLQTIVNAYLQSGTYIFSFDGSHLPSGIYFYQLSTPGYSEVNKFTLVK